MSRNPKEYLKGLKQINQAKLMSRSIYPYNPDENSREYNNLTFTHYSIYLAILKYHKKIIENLSTEFEPEKRELLLTLSEDIRKIQYEDIPFLDNKRFHILDSHIRDSNRIEIDQMLNEVKHNH